MGFLSYAPLVWIWTIVVKTCSTCWCKIHAYTQHFASYLNEKTGTKHFFFLHQSFVLFFLPTFSVPLSPRSRQAVLLITDVILWCSSFYTSGQHVVIETSLPLLNISIVCTYPPLHVCMYESVTSIKWDDVSAPSLYFRVFVKSFRLFSFEHSRFLHFAVVNTSAYASLNKATASLGLLKVATKK